jgi:pilus assembly protein CpaF
MAMMAGLALPIRAMRDYIASAIDLIVHLARLSDGSRKVMRVTEVVGREEDVLTTQDIFVFEPQGVDGEGRVSGQHRATGVRPKFSERLARVGVPMGADLFDPGRRPERGP